MVLRKPLQDPDLKPYFTVKVGGIDGKSTEVRAVLDTGSNKVIWCSSRISLSRLRLGITNEHTDLFGVGVGSQKDCEIRLSNIGVFSAGRGIQFLNVQTVISNKPFPGIDILLPYKLFHNFMFTFTPNTKEYRCGQLVIDTIIENMSGTEYYDVKSSAGVVENVTPRIERETTSNHDTIPSISSF